MKTTKDYQIVDYGIEDASYFQGHGHSFTRYKNSALGAGDNQNEALEDALEQAAMMGVDIELTEEDRLAYNAFFPSADEEHRRYCQEEDHSECYDERYYYVGLRWNITEEEGA